jgi:hypothetical protein
MGSLPIRNSMPVTAESLRPGRRRPALAGGAALLLTAWLVLASVVRAFPPAQIENTVKLRISSLQGLACASTTQCTAVNENGEEVTFNPSAPAPSSIGQPDGNAPDVQAVACPSADQCTLVDWNGHEVTFNPIAETSTPRFRLAEGVSLWAIACPSRTQCTAVGDHGYESTFNPQSPGGSSLVKIDSPENILAIACPTATQCTAATTEGEEVTFDPLAPTSPSIAVVDPNIRQSSTSKRAVLQDISCPSTTQCAATDENGREVSFDPLAPSGFKLGSLGSGVGARSGIACPTPSQCTMVDGAELLTFDPNALGTLTSSRWSPPSGDTVTRVACPAVTLCVAIDKGGPTEGTALVFNPNPGAASSTPLVPSTTSPPGPPINRPMSRWTRRQCQRAYRHWSKKHPHARRSTRQREVGLLRRDHACPPSALR